MRCAAVAVCGVELRVSIFIFQIKKGKNSDEHGHNDTGRHTRDGGSLSSFARRGPFRSSSLCSLCSVSPVLWGEMAVGMVDGRVTSETISSQLRSDVGPVSRTPAPARSAPTAPPSPRPANEQTIEQTTQPLQHHCGVFACIFPLDFSKYLRAPGFDKTSKLYLPKKSFPTQLGPGFSDLPKS